MTVTIRYLTDAHTHVSLLGLTRVWPLLQPGRFGHARSYDDDGHHLDVAVFMFWQEVHKISVRLKIGILVGPVPPCRHMFNMINDIAKMDR
jgi:hypothetical protein